MFNFLGRPRGAACLAAASTIAIVASMSSAYAQEQQRIFNIPAQPLSSALIEFSRQSDVMVVADPAVVNGRRAPAVQGTFTPSEALDRLLAGSGLSVEQRADGGFTLADASSPSQLGAADQAASRGEDEIVVVGSRIPRHGEGAAPVTVFDREEIDRLGATDVADVLEYLPQQSFSLSEQATFGGTRTVRLRGLGIGATLVLINGRRTTTSALLSGSSGDFDLNTIPLSAVERVEVLTDSASALYGADAVGGVVNIVLKDTVNRPDLNFFYGGADGGGEETRYSLSYGVEAGPFRAAITLDHLDRQPLAGEERSLFADQDFRRFGGVDARNNRTNPANICSTTTANLPGLPARCAIAPQTPAGPVVTTADFLPTAGQTNLVSSGQYGSIVPESERTGVLMFGEYDLSSSVTAFAEFLYSDRNDRLALTPAALVNANVPAANPFNPFGVPVVVNYLFTGVGPQYTLAENESYRAVLGLRGESGDANWEVTYLRTNEQSASWLENFLDTARVNAALSATSPTQALNVFQAGPAGDPALLRSLIAAPVFNRNEAYAEQLAGLFTTSLFDLPGGSVRAAIGAELREEGIHFESRPTISLDADRETWAIFGEVEVPIVGTAQQVPFVYDLSLNIAARHDHYSDFGDTFNPQVGLRWRPADWLLLRASYSTSFRTPSLFQLYSPQSSAPSSIADPRRGNQISPFTLLRGGNPNMDPETAETWTAGFLSSPGAFEFGVTYWNIKQDDRIQTLNQTLLLAGEVQFPDRIVRGPPSAADITAGFAGPLISINTTNVNFGRLETSGADLLLSYEFDTPVGTIKPALNATWVERFEAADLPNAPAFDRVGLANSNGSIPRWRANASVTWSLGDVSASVTGRYVSSYRDVRTGNVLTGREVDSQFLVDAQASLELGQLLPSGWADRSILRLGAINLFDEDPPFSEVANAGFDRSQADIRQRFLYVSLSHQF